MTSRQGFLPALGHPVLLPLYDPVHRWILRDAAFKSRLVDLAAIEEGHRVLDLGCGTATLAILAASRHPAAIIIGLDADGRALERGRGKARRGDVSLGLARALSGRLPFGDAGFDRVLSSMFFHHLPSEEKVTTLREIVRVLRPGGSLVTVDLGAPCSGYAAVMGKLWSHLEHAAENTAGALPTMMRAAGFDDVRELGGQETVVGSIAFHRAFAARTS